MKTFITSLFSLIILISTLAAQQQMQNPGFEQWEDVDVVTDEPKHWSSIKKSDDLGLTGLAPVVWGRSTDAHSGNYSLSLFNFYVALINDVATGMITNGRVHANLNTDSSYVFTDVNNKQWHGVLTDRPDSIAGWFKCNPAIGDFGTVKFLLHTGEAHIPGYLNNSIAEANYELPTQEVTQWTRFSAPFIYTSSSNPEYFLAVITSGNGSDALEGSTALFDDFEFIYNGNSVNELSENHFEVIVKNQQLIFLIGDNNKQLYELRLVDINGQTVLKSQITSGENSTVNIGELPMGLYIVIANNSQKAFTRKVIIN